MTSFTLGEHGTDCFTIHIKESNQRTEYWPVTVEIKSGGFSGQFKAEFLLQDLTRLYADLQRLHHDLLGSLTFHTLEAQLEFEMVGDGRGHFEVTGIARDKQGSQNELFFCFAFDQTFVPTTLGELDDIISQFSS